MSGEPDRVIEASGGVLWRPGEGGVGVEIALVHRPKYDDWSLPKGKLNPGEHVLLGAVREVEEESGYRGLPGPPLGSIGYLKDGRPKRVRYWSMRAVGGAFRPNDEVDQMMWLPPRAAIAHLTPDRDEAMVTSFIDSCHHTRPVVMVRHASAGDRLTWPGEDSERPLDDTGRVQARALAALLEAYDLRRAYSADVLRCLDTVAPFASRRQIPVTSEPLLSETGTGASQDASLHRLLEVLGDPEPSVLCTQRRVLNALLPALLSELHGPERELRPVRVGGCLVLHLSVEEPRIVAMDEFDPPGT